MISGPEVTLRKRGSGIVAVATGADIISRLEVLIGIPPENDDREEDAISNSKLLWIQTFGSPINNIPPRPLIEPALEASEEILSSKMEEAAAAALNGQVVLAKQILREVGQIGVEAVDEWFEDPRNGWEPNKPSTLRRKSGTTPLIDSEQLKDKITYRTRIRERGVPISTVMVPDTEETAPIEEIVEDMGEGLVEL